jgi:cobalt/nickel transport protein
VRRHAVNVVLLVTVVALVAVPLAVRAGHPSGGGAYAGTDGAAVSAVEQVDPGYRPWFSPPFASSSTEVQSGLFALQAALGAGALGFVLGRLSVRRRPVTAGDDRTGGDTA